MTASKSMTFRCESCYRKLDLGTFYGTTRSAFRSGRELARAAGWHFTRGGFEWAHMYCPDCVEEGRFA